VANLFPYYPVFLDLAGRSVVLIGADAAMAGLARQFLAAGAGVSVFDQTPSDAMRALQSAVRLKLRRWRPEDFQGAALVVCSAEEPRPSRIRASALRRVRSRPSSICSARRKIPMSFSAALAPLARWP